VINVDDLRGSFVQFVEVRGRNCAGVLFGSFTMVGSQIKGDIWTSILSEFTSQQSHSSCWCQSCCSLLAAIVPWSKLWQKFFSDPLHWWDGSVTVVVRWKNKYMRQISLADGKVRAVFSVLMITFMPEMWRIYGWSAWSGLLIVVNQRYPDFKHKKTQEVLWLDNKHNLPRVAAKMAAMAPGTVAIEHFCMELED
jgi:hypothetical protein